MSCSKCLKRDVCYHHNKLNNEFGYIIKDYFSPGEKETREEINSFIFKVCSKGLIDED